MTFMGPIVSDHRFETTIIMSQAEALKLQCAYVPNYWTMTTD